MKPRSKILISAGSDSSGGAGIQADIKTITALGSYTYDSHNCCTSPNTNGSKIYAPINSREILNQIMYTANDSKPTAIKIGDATCFKSY